MKSTIMWVVIGTAFLLAGTSVNAWGGIYTNRFSPEMLQNMGYGGPHRLFQAEVSLIFHIFCARDAESRFIYQFFLLRCTPNSSYAHCSVQSIHHPLWIFYFHKLMKYVFFLAYTYVSSSVILCKQPRVYSKTRMPIGSATFCYQFGVLMSFTLRIMTVGEWSQLIVRRRVTVPRSIVESMCDVRGNDWYSLK